MKCVLMIVVVISLCSLVMADTTIPGGDVSGNWLADGSPYLVQGTITVPLGEHLSIYPGCVVEFQGHYSLDVLGQLFVTGIPQDSVRFTVADTTGFYDPETNAGGWGGIRFLERDELGPQSLIQHAVITYGKNAASASGNRNGGAMRVMGNASVLVEDSRLCNNVGSSGGAIFVFGENGPVECTINRCYFQNNRAKYSGGGCYLCDEAHISNSLFIYNTGNKGSAVYVGYDVTAQLYNTTICNNITTYPYSGALDLDGNSDSEVINNIIWYNTGGQVYTNNNGSFTYNNIQGGLPDYSNYNETNIDIEPSFVEDSYQLKPHSICINSGTPDASALQLGDTDLAGNPRIYNGTASRIDMGAYEYQGEAEPLFPDFEADHTTGVAPLSVQFTDCSQGVIDEWHWDLDGDGEVDSYEQHPSFTYQEAGAFAVSLTIWRDGESVTCIKQNYIQTGLPQTSFDYFFHISKDTGYDAMRSLHLADMDGDGIDEIYLLYTNSEDDYWKIQGYDHQGHCILNHTEPQLVGKIRLFEWNDEFYILTSKIGNHYVDMKVYSIPDFAEVASLYNNLNSDYSYSIRDLEVDCSSGMPIIYQGYRRSWSYQYAGGSQTDMRKYDFNGSTLGFLGQYYEKGYLVYPRSNLTTNLTDWWDDMGGSGESMYVSKLFGGSSFLYLDEPGLCALIGDDDGSYINYGATLYISGANLTPVLRNYSPDYQTVLWQRELPLYSGHYAAANVSYNGGDWYLMLFDHLNEYVHIIDRYTGQTVDGHFTQRTPFSLKKTVTGGMLLFEKQDGGYDVYTNDSQYYTGIQNHEVPRPTQTAYLANYPNPFNPSTEIRFQISDIRQIEHVQIDIFNIKGQKVRKLEMRNEELEMRREGTGVCSLTWDGTDSDNRPVSSGLYFYQLKLGSTAVAQRKMMLLK